MHQVAELLAQLLAELLAKLLAELLAQLLAYQLAPGIIQRSTAMGNRGPKSSAALASHQSLSCALMSARSLQKT
jgi:hypothetical protein